MSYTNYDEFTEQYAIEWEDYDVDLEDCNIDIDSLEYNYGGFSDFTGTLNLDEDYDNIIVSKRKLREVFENKGYNEDGVRDALETILNGGRITLGVTEGKPCVVDVDTLVDEVINYLEA